MSGPFDGLGRNGNGWNCRFFYGKVTIKVSFLIPFFSFKKSDFQAFPVGGILGKQNDLAWFYCMVIQKSPCSYVFLHIFKSFG